MSTARMGARLGIGSFMGFFFGTIVNELIGWAVRPQTGGEYAFTAATWVLLLNSSVWYFDESNIQSKENLRLRRIEANFTSSNNTPPVTPSETSPSASEPDVEQGIDQDYQSLPSVLRIAP